MKILSNLVISFHTRPVLASGYCRCLGLSVHQSVAKFVYPITHHPFKVGSPNLDRMCKRPWTRHSLLFWGWFTLTFKVKLNFKVKIYRFWVSPVQARTTKSGPEVQDTLVKVPIVLGVDWAWHIKSNFVKNSVYLHSFGIFQIFAKTGENGVCSTYMFAHRVESWAMKQSSYIISVTIASFPVLDSAIGDGY